MTKHDGLRHLTRPMRPERPLRGVQNGLPELGYVHLGTCPLVIFRPKSVRGRGVPCAKGWLGGRESLSFVTPGS
jgi:hypothetical protein